MSATRDHFGIVGTTVEGRFAIDRVVARGGFGIVYQGRHLTLRRPVALKALFIPGASGPQEREMFLDGFAQEARLIADLDHPAIVRVFDFGVSRTPNGEEMPWMVMDWLEGMSLAEFIEAHRGQALPPREAFAIVRPVLQALAFAHARGVAHRDVKPLNIMLLGARPGERAGDVQVKLLDFGIAKVMTPDEGAGTGETHTRALISAWSPRYAAPEQKVGLKTGPWTDVHAMGLILTELLTGQAPYPGADRLDVEQRVVASTRPTPGLFGVHVGAWEAVIARAVALRTPDRFQDAGAFLVALETSAAEAPLPGSPVGMWNGSVPNSTVPWTPSVLASSPPPPSVRRAGLWWGAALAAGAVLAGGGVWVKLLVRSANLASSRTAPTPNVTAPTLQPLPVRTGPGLVPFVDSRSSGPMQLESVVNLDGRLSTASVQQFARTQTPWVETCYARALHSHPNLLGRVVVRVTGVPPSVVSLEAPDADESAFGTCVRHHFRTNLASVPARAEPFIATYSATAQR